jgi:DNA gyrase subunit A
MAQKERIIEKKIEEEMKSAYLDYAMSVIVSRALPDLRDGLKPVQRRILYGMKEMGLEARAKFRKSSAVVGYVMASFHPHGDAPIYEALVRMAQDFSLRYPLVLGQGNMGSIDGDPPASQRYTECKLSKIGEEILRDIEKETVDFIPNYDGTKKEPTVLPAPFPNILLNGSLGIAVGMTTNIPPHNLSEICDALIYLLDHKGADVEEIYKFVQGPDFPTGGIIFDKEQIQKVYSQGKGPITCRAKAKIEEKKEGLFKIVITEIPYLVEKSQLLQEIAQLVLEKKIEGIKNIRDESDREGLRIVIELSKNTDPQEVLKKLYQLSDLQKIYYVNLVALVDGILPRLLSLPEILKKFLEFRKEIILRRTKFDLERTKERIEILEGFEKCIEKIDLVISLIKKSENRQKAKEALMKRLALTERQADAILEMRLGSLSKLEREKILKELKEKREEIKKLEKILKSEKELLTLMKKEFLELKEKYGDKRRTTIVEEKLPEFTEEIKEEPALVLITEKGKIFRTILPKEEKLPRIKVSENDLLKDLIFTNTKEKLLLFSESGKIYQLRVNDIPKVESLKLSSKLGKSISVLLSIEEKEKIVAQIPTQEGFSKETFLVFVTNQGKIKKTDFSEFEKTRKGTSIISLKKDELLRDVRKVHQNEKVLIFTKKGNVISFPEKEIPKMGKGAGGVKGINLGKGDEVLRILSFKDKGEVLLITEKAFLKRIDVKSIRLQKRGGKGIRAIKLNEKSGDLIGVEFLEGKEELILGTQFGKIFNLKISSVPKMKREAMGKRMVKIKEEKISCFVVI